MAEINEDMKPAPSSQYKPSDPAKVPCPPDYAPHEEYLDVNFGCFQPSGPGGRRSNIENNEKGILESGLHELIGKHKYAALGSSHDAMRQGIYRTNSVGDRD